MKPCKSEVVNHKEAEPEQTDPRFKRWNIATQLRTRWMELPEGAEKKTALAAMTDFSQMRFFETEPKCIAATELRTIESPTKAEMAMRFAKIAIEAKLDPVKRARMNDESFQRGLNLQSMIVEDAVSLAEAIEARLNNQNASQGTPDGKEGQS